MNEEAIKKAYDVFKSGGYNGSIDDYKQLISTNGNALKQTYDVFKQGGYNQDIDSFKTLMGLKKKSDGGSTSAVGSLELQKPEDYTYGDSKSAYRKQGNQWLISNESTKGNYVAIKDPTGSRAKELEKNAVKKDNKFISKETKKEYQLEDNKFSEVNPEKQKALRELNAMKYAPPKPGPMGSGSMPAFSAEAIKIKEDEYNNIPSRINLEEDKKIKALNKQFDKNASLSADYEEFDNYDNSSEKKNNKYRIKDGSWERWVPGATEWSSISNEGSISALNRRYGKNIDAKKAIVVKPKEIDPFLKVNSNFLAQSEESAQEMLEKNFKSMGFTFEQTGVGGDYIKVTPNNGNEPRTFSFNNVGNSTRGAFSSPTGMGIGNNNSKELEKNVDQSVKLQAYLRFNASAEKEDDLSAVNLIKSNTSRGKAAYVDPNNFIENNKYYESEDYKNAFKELTFQQKKNEIRERERETVNLSIADGDGWLMESINEYVYGDTPDAKARKERLLKDKQTLYKSEEYKLYKDEQKKYDAQIGEKYDKLYDEYVIVKQSGDKEAIKTVKTKIEGAYSKDLIGDNLTHMTGTQYDLQRDINDFNKRKEKLQLDAKNKTITQEQYNDAVESLSSEAQRLDIAAKNVAATQRRMNALAGVYVTEKAKSGGFFGNFTNALVVGMDEVREPLSYIFPLIGKDLSGDEAREISLDSKIITPQQRQYYKDKGFSDEQIKNVLINNVQKNAIAANKRAIIETFGSDLTTEESKQNLGFFGQALVGVAASLPSMLTRAVPIVGAPLAFASMANMSYNAINEEMLNDTDFETTSEADRAVVAVPYALVMGYLENVGLRYMTSGKSTLLAKAVLSTVAKAIPFKAGREVAEKVINREVKSLIGKGAIKIVNGTLVEGETGFYQAALLDVGLKQLYNKLDLLDLKLTNKEGLTGGELFETPDTKMGVAGAILEGAAAEAIGGFAMSTVMTGSQLLINGKISLYNEEDLKFFEDFSSDQEFKKLIVSNLKTEMLNGTMTKGEAQSALNDINLVEGVFNSIDENISDEAKLIAFNLINERNRLEKEVVGKDPALSKEKNDRIKDINDKLGTLPLQILYENNIERATELETALKQKGAVIINGEKINRKAAQTELNQINQKVEDAVQKQAAGQVPVQPTTAVGEEVVQGEPTAEPQVLTEEGKTKEVSFFIERENSTLKNELSKSKKNLEDATSEEDRSYYEKEVNRREQELELFNSNPIEYAKSKLEYFSDKDEKGELKYPSLYSVYKSMYDELSTEQTTEVKGEKVVPLTLEEELQLLAKEKVIAPTLEAPVIESPVVEAEATPKEKVVAYRAEEQAELLKAIPKIESYKVKGKIDKTKMPKTVLAKYNKIYEKYNALISPLLPAVKTKTPVVKAPAVKAAAPKTQGKPTVMSWSKVEEYDDAVIRSMKEIQYGKLKPLLDLGKRTTVAQKEEIIAIQAKILTAEKILDKRANKIKKEAQRVEKEGKGATVRAVDNNGTEAEYSIVVSKDGATAKVQLKKIGTLTPKRASVEANLTIQTDEKRGRFVITKNKTKVYIDEAITPAKVEPTKAKVTPEEKVKVEPIVEMSKEIEEAIAEERLFLESMIEDGAVGFDKDLQLLNSNPYKYADEKNKKFSKKDKNGKFLNPESRNKYLEFYLTIRGRAEAKAPVKEEVKLEAPVVEAKAPVKEAPAPAKESTDDLMGVINSIKEDIKNTTKEIEDARAEAREKVNKIREEILDLKESIGKEGTIMDLEADITEIEDILKEDLDGLKLDLDRHVQALKEEVKKIEYLDAKNPENKNTLISYLDAAIKTLNGLDKLTYAKLDAGVTLATLKLILKGIRAGVIAGNTIKASISAMASQYRGEHKNKKITIAEFTKEIEEYLRNTFVDQKTNEQDIQEARDKFVEIREAVRKAKIAVKTESKTLRANAENAIREMLKGKVKDLSSVQMKSIILRLANFNVFSQTQYDKFIDYVDKVISIADYDAEVDKANKNRKNAKNNTIGKNPKLGDLSLDLLDSLSRVLNINAKLIPSDVFESYSEIVEMLSKRDAVLELSKRNELNESLNKIIESIELNDEKISDLKDLYDNFADKVVESGVVNYAKTLDQMLKDGVIDKSEYDLMKTFKSKIQGPKVKEKMTEQDIADEKAELINETFFGLTINLNEIVGDEFRLERDLVKKLKVLLKNQKILESLNNKELKDLLRIIDNINNGFVSNATQQMVERLNSIEKSILLESSIPESFKSIIKTIKEQFNSSSNAVNNRIRVAPLFNIDQQLGDFKTKNIFNSVFNESAKAQQGYQSEITLIQDELSNIEREISNSKTSIGINIKKDRNSVRLSRFKMMVYMMQLEYNSNINNQTGNKKQVHQAMDTLNKTIEVAKKNRGKSGYSLEDIKLMESIKEQFAKDSQIDIDKLYNSFNEAEKNGLKKLQEINNRMTKFATYTATVINGNKIIPLKNYISYTTINESDILSSIDTTNQINDMNANMQPGTKSKNLEERDGNVHAVVLDPFYATNSSSRSVLLNYHMTEAVRTARKTLKNADTLLSEKELKTQDQLDILAAITDAYNEATKDLLESNFHHSNERLQFFKRQGYRAMLASGTRASAELLSNYAFVGTNNPLDFKRGKSKEINKIKGADKKSIMTILQSKVSSRLFPTSSMNSIFVDAENNANRSAEGNKAKTKIINGVTYVFDNTTRRWVDIVAASADYLISKPDQLVMRPLWFGAFSRTFEKEAGIKPDFDKIMENDEEYMDKYKDALEKATTAADKQVTSAGSSMNAYMGILKNVVRKDDAGLTVAAKEFNRFMNKFTVQEYYTAREGVRALVGNGTISRTEGAQVLAAVTLRMTIYSVFTRLFAEGMLTAARSLGFAGDDDDDDKTIKQKISQGILSTVTTLVFGRYFGNFIRVAENALIESVNKEYGDDIGLRDGKYDPYKDAIQFNQLQEDKMESFKITDFAKIISGPYGPLLGVGDLGLKLLFDSEPKGERAKLTRKKELYRRLPLEIGGQLGVVPFYKDIRKIVMEGVYKELKKETKEKAVKTEAREIETATTNRQKISSLRKMRSIGEYTDKEINKAIRIIKNPEYKKAFNDKEEAIKKKILDEYGYDNLEDFEINDEKNYEIEFGDDSKYRIERAESARIANELEKRMDAIKYGKPYVPKKELTPYERQQKERGFGVINRPSVRSSYSGSRKYSADE